MRWVLGVALLALAGCQTQPVHEMSYSQQQEWAKSIVQTCHDQGIANDQLEDCVRAEAIRDTAIRQRNAQNQARARMAISQGMAQHGQNLQRQAAINSASMSRSVNCRTRPMGAGTYSTSCY